MGIGRAPDVDAGINRMLLDYSRRAAKNQICIGSSTSSGDGMVPSSHRKAELPAAADAGRRCDALLRTVQMTTLELLVRRIAPFFHHARARLLR